MTKPTVKTSLVLRVCRANHTSRHNFAWPQAVGEEVVAPDWNGNKSCGNGLHGWLYGQGDHSCVDYWEDQDAKWYVLEVPSDSIVMLGGKCKFPRATVRFIGAKSEAAAYIIEHEPQAREVAVIGACLKVDDKGSVSVGGLGTATAGNYGTATAGNYGTATAGNYGTATAGESGTATAGYRGTATAGYRGEIQIKWYDEKAERYRTVVGYVGEDGIKPDTTYQLDARHKLVEVSE